MAESTETDRRPIDEAARRKFEAAWRGGQPPVIEEYLPAPDNPTFAATLEELVLIDLEFAWKVHRRRGSEGTTTAAPRVEAYLARFPHLEQPSVLLRLLRHEYQLRLDHGDTPVADEYQQRFPRVLEDQDLLTVTARTGPGGVVSVLRSGDQLGRYRLDQEHARGGFGLVWRANDEALGREVAVKQLSTRLATDPTHRRRFLAEARVAAQLQHPGVVPVYDLGGAESPHPFYAMKLVRGQTFGEAIMSYHADTTSGGERAVRFLRLLEAYLSIVRAMAFAHSHGVIHRDLKPANIVLGDFGETVILDWGLAKVLRGGKDEGAGIMPTPQPTETDSGSEVTRQGTIVGTPAYMSPEQARGEIDAVDERSDVYALGAMLFQLLTGRLPYDGSAHLVLRKLASGEPPPRPRAIDSTIAPPLEAVCLKALTADPGRRYQSADELARDVERFLADEPVAAYPEPARVRLSRWARRHTTAVTTATVALILTLIGSAVGFVALDRAEQNRVRAVQDRIARQRNAAETDRELAKVEVGARRFKEAVRLLDAAAGYLGDEPDFADLRPDIERRRDRAYRLAEFYRQIDQAERLLYRDKDVECLAACEDALRHLGALPPAADWWQKLPFDDLQPAQRAQLRDDTARALMLLCGVRIKRALQASQQTVAQAQIRDVLSLMPPIQAYHEQRWGRPADAGRILDLFCRYVLGERDGLPTLEPPDPVSAPDCYFTGFLHLFFSLMDENYVKLLLPEDLRARMGLDTATFRQRAEEMFRRAVILEPRHFWSHLWLGMILRLGKQYPGAEQAYNACLALRAESALALTLRTEMLVVRLGKTADVKRQREIWEYARSDLERAFVDEPNDPLTHWVHARLLAVLGDDAGALAAATRALDLEVPADPLTGPLLARQPVSELWPSGTTRLANDVKAWAQPIVDRRPKDPEAWVLLGYADVCGMEPSKAMAPLRKALELAPGHGRAQAVRGAALLKRDEPKEALPEFSAAVAAGARDYLPVLGLARAHEEISDWARALAAFDELLARPAAGGRPAAVTDWQVVEVQLGRARMLAKLGRPDESAKALDAARLINPGADIKTRRGLFP